MKYGLKWCLSDSCVYVELEVSIILVLYVDNILFGLKIFGFNDKIVNYLKEYFDMIMSDVKKIFEILDWVRLMVVMNEDLLIEVCDNF